MKWNVTTPKIALMKKGRVTARDVDASAMNVTISNNMQEADHNRSFGFDESRKKDIRTYADSVTQELYLSACNCLLLCLLWSH